MIKSLAKNKNDMQRISSNATLFLKIFIPTFWIVFIGLLTFAIVLSNVKHLPGMNFMVVKVGFVFFFLAGTGLLYATLMQLKRVELDELYVYASNYFKTYRYPYHNVERITERDLGLFHLVRLYLKTPGKFGKRITFLLDEAMLQDFLDKHPDVARQFDAFRIEQKS